MSDAAPAQLDLKEQLARIDRSQEETRKFVSEQHKLMAEQQKLMAEQQKLHAEAAKLSRDRLIAPFVVMTSLMASLSTGVLVAVLSHFWR